MKADVLFLTLKVFSATGGIEKVCRVAGKAIYETGLQAGFRLQIFSMYGPKDIAIGNKYFPVNIFTGFGARKIKYVLNSISTGRKSRVVMLSHINLLMVGWLIKFFNPSAKLILLAHGIEVWKPLPRWKIYMLRKCDHILPVSNFTKEKMKALYHLPEEQFTVINNCIDPFLQNSPGESAKKQDLQQRYGIGSEDKVLLTVARLSATEQYKGYDKVINALHSLRPQYPCLRYIIAGKYDESEKQRLLILSAKLGVQDMLLFTGFIAEEELAAHFDLATMYVMPSSKEGFGIVFIEAMYYGKPVIAGNKDGSVDALLNGELGLLVDPDDTQALVDAIKKVLDNSQQYLPDKKKLEENFSYTVYKQRLKGIILERAV